MIFTHQPNPKLSDENWRRINMRKVAHLIGAEMIHNLYGRHWPQINSVRFSNTKTTYKDGVVDSYAPIDEWTYLQRWVSEKFLNLDTVIIREIEAILHPTYSLTNELCLKIDNLDLDEVSNSNLATLLIDIMDIPLGEIYKLNVVQIEYGLNYAIDTILQDYEPDKSERNRLLAKIISPVELTVAQEEEVAFGGVVDKARALGDKYSSDKEISVLLMQHYDSFAGKHCAYGELPPDIAFYEEKLKLQLSKNRKTLTHADAQTQVQDLHNASQTLLEQIADPRLTTLCNLMSRIGVFRDKNKARLGDTVLRRLKLLDAIANRCSVTRSDLDHYLLTEIVNLLDTSEQLSDSRLQTRKAGVTFVRSESLRDKAEEFSAPAPQENSNKITGICASPGVVTGTTKVITSHNDIDKMNEGDIMVAIGTDFDLIEIMHRSAGIITEEGGLLSHASVVSRELKKPCLIGVRQATQLLRDGTKITLNATEGYFIHDE